MYTCIACHTSSPTKLWKCPSCWSFATFELDDTKDLWKKTKWKHDITTGKTLISQESNSEGSQKSIFWPIEHQEFKRTFQDGIKKGGVYLLWWEPGIWKSTIMLQIIFELQKKNNLSIAYFTWEENESQVTERYQRISFKNPALVGTWFITSETSESLSVFHATHFEDIITTTKKHSFDIIIIDSIQTVYSPHNDSPAGSPNQVRYTSEKISEFCKTNNITSFIIWHVTKWGEIAWPKYLEHIVDVVLYLEWDRFWQLRFLRSQKNRFWHTDDSSIFEMTTNWLQAVYDLKDRIVSNAHLSVPWNVLTIGLDNWRPVIANVEVLLTKTNNSNYLSRNCVWVNAKRVDMIIAILQKYLWLKLYMYNIYINIPGEFTFYDSWLDLAIAVAILSQYHDKAVQHDSIRIGELGLSGQISPSKFHDKRKREIPSGFSLIDQDTVKYVKDIEL